MSELRNRKSVRVSFEVWAKLNELKEKWKAKSVDEVFRELLKNVQSD